MSETKICESCSKKINTSIRYCPHCGAEQIQKVINSTPICPKCKCSLDEQAYQEADLDICPTCSGIWLGPKEFKQFTSERNVYKDDTIPYEYKKKALQIEKGYKPCPLCNKLMTRKNFRQISGVLIDICRDHGIWLDSGEFEQIRCFIANGGIDQSQDRNIINNKIDIKNLANDLQNVKFMQRAFHFKSWKYWLFH